MDYAVYIESVGQGRSFRFRYIAAPIGLVGPGYRIAIKGHCPRSASDRGLYLNDANLKAIYKPYDKKSAEKRAKGLNKSEKSNW